MKRPIYIIGIPFLIFVLGFSIHLGNRSNDRSDSTDIKPALGFPEEIQKILNNSCLDCHTADGMSEDAKEELNFTDWYEYEDSEKISLLEDICEEMGEREMPPRKYINNHPDSKPDDEQIKKVCEWTKEETKKIME